MEGAGDRAVLLLFHCPCSAEENNMGLYYIGKNGSATKHKRLRGKMAVVLPAECPRSEGLLAGTCRTQFKSPLFPRAGGHGYK